MTRMPPPPAVGETFSERYRLDSVIGSGASSVVFEATDLHTNRRVAVKVLRAELAQDGALRRRFRREADVLKRLSHPCIVRWLDFMADPAGHVYMVTEWIGGASLRKRLAQGAMEVSEVASIVVELCNAVHDAHGHGVLHGDIKPDNVILLHKQDPQSRLLDFGTSKILGLDRLTRTGELAGTPEYMAPELLTGQGTIGPSIDLYSLGVVAYECLSGAVPFSDGHVGRLLFKVASGDALPLDKVVDVSSDVAAVVAKSMHVRVEGRYTDAAEMGAAWGKLR